MPFIFVVIKIIRSSRTDEESKQKLHDALGLTDRQAQAVIDMQLKRLTGLAIEKLVEKSQTAYGSIFDWDDEEEYTRLVEVTEEMVKAAMEAGE